MAQSLAGGQVEAAPSEAARSMQVADQAFMKEMAPIRLPKTPEEEKELEEIAIKGGPRAVYSWIYGPDSPMVQAVPASTWVELGITDPIQGLHQILDGIRQFQGSAVVAGPAVT